MNKYLLTFKNPKIETQYQNTSIGEIRMTMFTLITLGFTVVFVVRIGQGLLQKNYLNVATYIGMIAYFSIQYFLAKRYRYLLRASLILLNHVFTIYFLFIEESTDSLSAHLRGVNQMGSNFLIILAGEYIDAMFSLISISAVRIIIIFIKSSSIEYSAIFSAFILILYASRYLYQYHKAIRAQYLLTLVEQSWDNILDQIIKETPFILFKFDEELVKFQIQKTKNCEKLFSNTNEAGLFLRESVSGNQTLEQIIYTEIQKFQLKRQDEFCKQIQVNFRKIQIQLEYSIFFGNQPSILIVLSNQPQQRKINETKQYKHYLEFFIYFCQLLIKAQNRELLLKNMKKKFIILKLRQDFQERAFKMKNINIHTILQKLQQLYPDKHIRSNSTLNFQINSSNSLLNLFFICIMETLLSETIVLNCNPPNNGYIIFHFKGEFDVSQLSALLKGFLKKIHLIIDDVIIAQSLISFKLYQSAFQPFEF